MKVAFISSLERSGSTILDLKMASRSDIVGFGEVWRVIKPHGAGLGSVRGMRCTCGKMGNDCSFWSSVFSRIETSGAETLAERYEIFLNVARQKYGDDIVVVDSSKSIQSLKALSQIKNTNIYVLFAVRDVRGWMCSIRKAEKRKKEMSWGKVFDADFGYFFWAFVRLNILRAFPLWLPNEWLLRNLRILKNLKKRRSRFLKVSYEELVFEPDNTFSKIERFLGITSEQQGIATRTDTLHIIRGNRTAFTTDPNAPLRYDTLWMSKWKSSVVLFLLPWVAWYNTKWVYGYLHRKTSEK